MYHFIRDHNKKFMAIFAVVLMVAFLLPAGFQQMTSRDDDAVRTYMGDTPITVGDIRRASNAWDILNQEVQAITSFGETVPLLVTLGNPAPSKLIPLMQGQRPQSVSQMLPAQFVGNPTTFMLLWKEAQAAGIRVSDERLDEIMAMKSDIVIRKEIDPRSLPAVREAIRDFLMVQASYARVSDAAKASEPLRRRAMASRWVRISADIASFDAAPAGIPTTAATGTTAPSDDRLKAHFEKYADQLSGAVSETNALGFGYRVPDRVKLQTLAITNDQLKSAVEKSRTPHQWNVESVKYFYNNPSEFPDASVTPTSLPTDSSPFDLRTPVATTGPTTKRTFDSLTADQKKQAMDRVLAPEIAALSTKITAYINDRFSRDYVAAKPATQPTTGPVASPTTLTYMTYGYLEGVAGDVQKQFGVLPSVADHGNWLDGTGVGLLPGISMAGTQTGTAFPQAVFRAQPFVDGQATTGARPRLHEFSLPLQDFSGGLYYFRLTGADRAHRPTSMDEVRPQVAIDLARQDAADTAVTAAKALLTEAAKSGFGPAATTVGKPVVSVGPLDMTGYSPVLGLDIPDADRTPFFRGLGQILSSATRDPAGKPLGTILLPTSRKVLAVNITSAPLELPTDETFTAEQITTSATESDLNTIVQADWFSFDGVSKRVNYKGEKPEQGGM